MLTAAPKSSPPLRHAADDAGLGGQRQVFEHALLGRHRGQHLGHADAEVDDAAQRQLEGAATRDQLAFVQRRDGDLVGRHAQRAGIGGVVGGAVGLLMEFGRRDDDAVDQHARNHHAARVERAVGGDALDLGDHQPVGIARRHRGRLRIEQQAPRAPS